MARCCQKVTPSNLQTVLTNLRRYLVEQIDQDPTAIKIWCAEINEMLDRALDEDAFGTEGQLDPRGDHRKCCG